MEIGRKHFYKPSGGGVGGTREKKGKPKEEKMKSLLVAPSFNLRSCSSYLSPFPKFFIKLPSHSRQLPFISHLNSTTFSVRSPTHPHPRPTFSVMASSATDSPSKILSAAADGSGSGEVNVFQLIRAHQEKAARLPPIEEARTVLDHSLRGVLSTFSQDLLANPKCSLLVAKDPEDRTDLVITVHGDAVPVSGKDKDPIRTAYLARHPDAFWVDFGDFQFLRIEPKIVRYVSGVATAILGSGEFGKEEFRIAKVDPIYQFSKPITSHMNKDHAEDTKLIVQHATSVPVEFAYMLDVDSLGFNVKAGYQGSTFKLRIPFTRRAAERKDVKTLIVEMLEAARNQSK